jgi:hypothetical protein
MEAMELQIGLWISSDERPGLHHHMSCRNSGNNLRGTVSPPRPPRSLFQVFGLENMYSGQGSLGRTLARVTFNLMSRANREQSGGHVVCACRSFLKIARIVMVQTRQGRKPTLLKHLHLETELFFLCALCCLIFRGHDKIACFSGYPTLRVLVHGHRRERVCIADILLVRALTKLAGRNGG